MSTFKSVRQAALQQTTLAGIRAMRRRYLSLEDVGFVIAQNQSLRPSYDPRRKHVYEFLFEARLFVPEERERFRRQRPRFRALSKSSAMAESLDHIREMLILPNWHVMEEPVFSTFYMRRKQQVADCCNSTIGKNFKGRFVDIRIRVPLCTD